MKSREERCAVTHLDRGSHTHTHCVCVCVNALRTREGTSSTCITALEKHHVTMSYVCMNVYGAVRYHKYVGPYCLNLNLLNSVINEITCGEYVV